MRMRRVPSGSFSVRYIPRFAAVDDPGRRFLAHWQLHVEAIDAADVLAQLLLPLLPVLVLQVHQHAVGVVGVERLAVAKSELADMRCLLGVEVGSGSASAWAPIRHAEDRQPR